jgi:hypothetical protein
MFLPENMELEDLNHNFIADVIEIYGPLEKWTACLTMVYRLSRKKGGLCQF